MASIPPVAGQVVVKKNEGSRIPHSLSALLQIPYLRSVSD